MLANILLSCTGVITTQQHNNTTTQKKQLRFLLTAFLLWCHQESNRGHKDFQSFALPTELWHQLHFWIASAKVMLFVGSRNFLSVFLYTNTKISAKNCSNTLYGHDIPHKMHFFGKILRKNCVYIRKNLYLCTRFWDINVTTEAIGM